MIRDAGPALFFAALAVLSLTHLVNGYNQFRSTDYPAVQGRMTRYEWEDSGSDAGRELKVGYRYTVEGVEHHGDRIRFLFRPLRIGTERARSRALTWSRGNAVEVFFDPSDPKIGLLDKGICMGDWISLAFAGLLLPGSLAGIARLVWAGRRLR